MEHPSITYAESPYAIQSCRDIDTWEASRELERAVREAVDESVIVHWDECTWYVFADGWRVRSVEEALERTGGE